MRYPLFLSGLGNWLSILGARLVTERSGGDSFVLFLYLTRLLSRKSLSDARCSVNNIFLFLFFASDPNRHINLSSRTLAAPWILDPSSFIESNIRYKTLPQPHTYNFIPISIRRIESVLIRSNTPLLLLTHPAKKTDSTHKTASRDPLH